MKDARCDHPVASIRDAVKDSPVTLVQVAGELGISYQSLMNQITRRTMSLERAAVVARLLGCDLALVPKGAILPKGSRVLADPGDVAPRGSRG